MMPPEPAPTAREPVQSELRSNSAEETREIGRRLGRGLAAGDVVLLAGDLGAGKTTLAQGIAAGLGVAGPIQSPTFMLVNEYDGARSLRFYHLDLYRLDDPAAVAGFGYEEYLEPADGVAVVEWPERAGPLQPASYLLVSLEAEGGEGRRIRFAAFGGPAAAARWRSVLAALDLP